MALETIEGQPRAVALLRRALEGGRVAHAYAFVGPVGSGRTTAALAFAGALLCEAERGCGACHGCRLVAGRHHPDLHLIVPTPPESNPRGPRAIRIAAIRELERQAALRPAMAGRRVFVVDDAERMTGEAPQAFLKFLEEPPPGTTVILILPRARAVPATVISRCQIVRFEARDTVRAGAALGEAVRLLDEVRAEGAPGLFRSTERLDRDRAEALVDGCWLLCRDLLVARAGAPPRLLTDAGRGDAIAREAARWTADGILAMIETCREARRALARNVAPRLTLEVVLSRLSGPAA